MESLYKDDIELLDPYEDSKSKAYMRDFMYGRSILGVVSTRPSIVAEPSALVRVFDWNQEESSSLEYRADKSTELIDAITDDDTARELIGGAIIAHYCR